MKRKAGNYSKLSSKRSGRSRANRRIGRALNERGSSLDPNVNEILVRADNKRIDVAALREIIGKEAIVKIVRAKPTGRTLSINPLSQEIVVHVEPAEDKLQLKQISEAVHGLYREEHDEIDAFTNYIPAHSRNRNK